MCWDFCVIVVYPYKFMSGALGQCCKLQSHQSLLPPFFSNIKAIQLVCVHARIHAHKRTCACLFLYVSQYKHAWSLVGIEFGVCGLERVLSAQDRIKSRWLERWPNECPSAHVPALTQAILNRALADWWLQPEGLCTVELSTWGFQLWIKPDASIKTFHCTVNSIDIRRCLKLWIMLLNAGCTVDICRKMAQWSRGSIVMKHNDRWQLADLSSQINRFTLSAWNASLLPTDHLFQGLWGVTGKVN